MATLLVMLIAGAAMQQTTFGPTLVFPALTQGAPFQADFEQVVSRHSPDGKAVRTSLSGTIYRDGKSRRRQDTLLEVGQGEGLAFSYIHDAVGKVIYVLDRVKKTATRERLEDSVESNTESDILLRPDALNSEITVESLEGLVCRVYRKKIAEKIEIESWFSEELKEVVFEKRVTSSEEKTISLFNIQQIEPNPQLFLVPEGYEIK